MKEKWKPALRTGLIYMVVISVTLILHGYYQQSQTQAYVDRFKERQGHHVIGEIADTYKTTIEMYSNYKLNKEAKKATIDKLNRLSKKLHAIDQDINSRDVAHQIDFAFIYHDIKLVNIALSDATKDDIIPVVILHGMEGLGEIKKEITYIEYR